MVGLLRNRLLTLVLIVAGLSPLAAQTAIAKPRPARLSAAVAVTGAGKPRARASACGRRQLRASASRALRRARHGARGRARRVRLRRRARTLRSRCVAHRGPRPEGARAEGRPAPETGPLAVGIDGGYAGWSETEVEEREQLGAAVTRHEWNTSEPVDAQDDVVLTAAAQIHTRIHALLGENDLGDANSYRDWVVGFVRRYGPGGSFWSENPELDASRYAITTIELGNEPYFGGMSAAEYADAVRPTLEEVHNLGLPVKVVLDSRVYGDDTSWMDTLYRRIPDLNSLFYAFADHPYWYGHDPAESSPAGPFDRIQTLRARMAEQGAGGKPIFITEYGESTAGCGGECVGEDTQAEHLGRMIDAVAGHPEWGVELLCVYQLRDRGSDSGERELEFGLLRQDGSPKPSYQVVESAMRQYRG